jgi:hypothetical protein
MSEKRKFRPLSANQVKNQQKKEEKLDVITGLEK